MILYIKYTAVWGKSHYPSSVEVENYLYPHTKLIRTLSSKKIDQGKMLFGILETTSSQSLEDAVRLSNYQEGRLKSGVWSCTTGRFSYHYNFHYPLSCSGPFDYYSQAYNALADVMLRQDVEVIEIPCNNQKIMVQ